LNTLPLIYITRWLPSIYCNLWFA